MTMDQASDDAPQGRLPLAEVLAEIGEEFRRAETLAAEHPSGPMVGWHGATVELSTELTRDASGRVKAWVLEAGAGVKTAEALRITVHLSPWAGYPIPGGK